MANLTLSIGGRPLKIQCSDQNIEQVKEIGGTISKLIENGFYTSVESNATQYRASTIYV